MATPTNTTSVNTTTAYTTPSNTNYAYTTEGHHIHRDGLCYKSIIAGAFVSVLAYSGLMALGLAFGGANLQGVIQGPDTMKGLGIGAVIWIVANLVISLAAGGYIAGRSRAHQSLEAGRTQGLVVAAIFFMFILAQFGSAVATVGKGAGMAVGAAGDAIGAAAMDPRVNDMAEDIVGDTNLKSPPEVVARGLGRRIVRGDTDGAVDYYAYQTGQTKNQARAKVTKLEQDAKNAATEAGIAAARAMKFAGWMLFTAIVSGAIAAFFAGGMGGEAERTLTTESLQTRRGTA
ncbi:MAG: hypothetical protein H7301_12485 [Cryobacterium sp.]|nr:hypothetical protein [Oligoflexia bacterium]